jgi:hypothetical protein
LTSHRVTIGRVQQLITEQGAPVEDPVPDTGARDESGPTQDGQVFADGAQGGAELGGQVAGGGRVVEFPQDAGAILSSPCRQPTSPAPPGHHAGEFENLSRRPGSWPTERTGH